MFGITLGCPEFFLFGIIQSNPVHKTVDSVFVTGVEFGIFPKWFCLIMVDWKVFFLKIIANLMLSINSALHYRLMSIISELSFLGVVKYKPSAFFRKLCDACKSALALSSFYQSKPFPKFSPNPNECMHERSEDACMHAHARVAEVPKKSGQLILNDILFY